MVQLSHTKENSDKKNEIIAAAQKRFGMFGMKKTSMMEIAYDLAMSKGLLYYYFPDKEHLYNAVVRKEIEEFKTKVKEHLQTLNVPSERLKEFVRLRLINFRTLLNLSRFRLEEMKCLNSVMNDSWKDVREFEKEIIIDILKNGNEQGMFNVDQPEEIAELLFDLLRGLRITMLKDKQLYYLEQQDYELLVKKTETFIDMFIYGLINKNVK
jgi:AcrR family transcriptional regulator